MNQEDAQVEIDEEDELGAAMFQNAEMPGGLDPAELEKMGERDRQDPARRKTPKVSLD